MCVKSAHSRIARLFIPHGLLTISLALVPMLLTGQEVKVKKVPVTQSDPNSGQQMFVDYCAPCHGINGKGDGPAVPALRMPPTNLSQLAKNNDGSFPSDHLANVLRFGKSTPAHGSKDMPIWGKVFASLSASPGDARAESALRINNLIGYIKTLQTK